MKVKLRSRDHSSTNSKHAYAEGSVTNLKKCYGESADNFLLTYVYLIVSLHEREGCGQTVRIFMMTEADKCKDIEILILTDRSTTCRLDTILPVHLPM
jgi:hypothetical protein